MHLRPLVLLACAFVGVPSCKRGDAGGGTGAAASATPAATGAAPVPVATAVAATGASAPLLGGFEGAIAMHTTGAKGQSQDMLFLTKGGKLRMDVPGHGGEVVHSIVDPSGGRLFVIMDPVTDLAGMAHLPHPPR